MNTRSLIAALILLPALAWAGANETPGEFGRPHKFSSFSPNLFEFGVTETLIFQTIVVGNQHYAQGASHQDWNGEDLDTESAGVWNFFEFCSSQEADVMLMDGHGIKDVGTLVAEWPDSINHVAVGRAYRDSVLAYYNGIFGAGCLVGMNFTDHTSGIIATQQFYTNYFMTPQALAWWSTCYSAQLNLTGLAEARCSVGYDVKVSTGKTRCDERTILGRMDGQEGQMKRPLGTAIQGINATCVDKAKLIARGKLNTVLSPSVLDVAPTGIVCTMTDGFILFDTSMDTHEPPDQAAQAYGDGFLINQAWWGDDMLTFTVIPTTDYPSIEYHAHESHCRSAADRARLDGNTWPGPQNALGPNRDDYVWHTLCPGGPVPVKPCYPTPPSTPVMPGYPTRVSSGLSNNTPVTQHVTIALGDERGWVNQAPQETDIAPDSFFDIWWEIDIPADALPGLLDSLIVTVTGDFDPVEAFGELTVGSYVTADLLGDHILLPGVAGNFELRLDNLSEVPAEITNLELISTPPVDIFPETPDFTLDAGEAADIPVSVNLPPGSPDGELYDVTVHATVDGLPQLIGRFLLSAGLPVTALVIDEENLVVGKIAAPMILELENHSNEPWILNFTGSDSNGFILTLPPETPLGPFEKRNVELLMEIPPDPLLIGTQGQVNLGLVGMDSEVYSRQFDLPYRVGPALSLAGLEEPDSPFYTGTEDGPFTWTLQASNLSDSFLEGTATLDFWGPVTLPFDLPAGGTESLSFGIDLDPGTEAGLYSGSLAILSASGLADQVRNLDLTVSTPVIFEFSRRLVSGMEGEIVSVEATLRNLRPAVEMSGNLEWHDGRSWLVSSPVEAWTLPPDAVELHIAEFQIPSDTAFAPADSDSVWVQVDMTGDFGQPLAEQDYTWLMVLRSVTAVPEDGSPAFDRLDANFPNPFNPATFIRFHLAKDAWISLTVHDLAGRKVAQLANGPMEAGTHEIRWKGVDDRGRALSSGVYLIRLKTPEGRWTRKAILVR